MRSCKTILVAAAMLAAASCVLAAEPQAPGKAPVLGEGRGQVVLSWDEFVKITGYDPAQKAAQVLTVPWAQVEELLGVKVENVNQATTIDLPWKDFKSLLEWSIKRKEAKPEAPPPTDYVVASSSYVGALTSDSADFTLTLKLNILREKGWKRIGVLPNEVALKEAKLPPDGVFLNNTGNGYEILTEKSGPVELALAFTAAVGRSAGINNVCFSRVLAGSSTLELTIDRENVDVKVGSGQSLVSESKDGKTHVMAAIPSNVGVNITWERALPKVEAAPTKLYADTRTLVAVAEGMLLCQETVNYNILHTPVRELKLKVPADTSVLTVTGPGVQDWRVDKGELQVVLRGEVIGSYSLRLTYERAAKDVVETPVIRAVGAEREIGYIGVIAVSNVEIAPGKITGAATVDVRQLPADIAAMTNQPILLGFRYIAEEFSIPVTIKKHEAVSVLITIADSCLITGMQLSDGRRMTKILYSIRNNRNQFLRLQMPKEAEVWSVSVSGNTVSPAKDAEGRLLIPLIRSAGDAKELAAFPVEIVYVETPAKPAPASGKLRVDLPVTHVPVMHVMYNLYLPAEGKYTVPEGLFGSRPGFSGPMRLVESFAGLSTGPGADVVARNQAKQASEMQQQFAAQADAAAKAAGAAPIRVQLPINGKLFKLEKILCLQGDELYFEVVYSGWEQAK